MYNNFIDIWKEKLKQTLYINVALIAILRQEKKRGADIKKRSEYTVLHSCSRNDQ